MIKRWYSLSVKKPHNDGKGSYSYNSHMVCWKSWIAEPNLVLDFQLKLCKESLLEKPGNGPLEIICFSRL